MFQAVIRWALMKDRRDRKNRRRGLLREGKSEYRNKVKRTPLLRGNATGFSKDSPFLWNGTIHPFGSQAWSVGSLERYCSNPTKTQEFQWIENIHSDLLFEADVRQMFRSPIDD
jgi:hypothetical protein